MAFMAYLEKKDTELQGYSYTKEKKLETEIEGGPSTG